VLKTGSQLTKIRDSIARNTKLVFTIISYIIVLTIFINLSATRLPLIGMVASLIYFLINGTILGHALFEKEGSLLRFILGNLLLIMLIGLIGWMVMIAFNLDILRSVIVLSIVTTLTLFIGMVRKRVPQKFNSQHNPKEMPKRLNFIELAYLFLVALLFYSLFASRSVEVRTVWEVLNPLFIPLYFITSFLLISIVFSRGSVEYKLLFIIIHSILSHSLFVVIFPAGDVGAQTLTSANSRLVYENVSIDGWPVSLPPTSNILSRIYYWFRGINFQTALSVMFARMFGVDIFWSHLWLVPILWGMFIPVAAFMVSRAVGIGEKASLIAGLVVSLFPSTIYYGAVSVPNSIGFIFLFFTLYFALGYLSNGLRSLLLLLIFSFFSSLSHFLTGVLSLSLLLLVTAVKKYGEEKDKSLKAARVLWFVSFVFSASLLPLSLLYQRFLFPFYTYFSLDRLNGLSGADVALLFLFGEYVNFSIYGAVLHMLGSVLGFFGMIWCLRFEAKKNCGRCSHAGSIFLFTAFLMCLADYRILKLFIVGVPFNEERIWVFRDLLAVPFLALLIDGIARYLHEKVPKTLNKLGFPSLTVSNFGIKLHSLAIHILIFIAISGWLTVSFYYGYPHYGPLQVTSYELDAVRFIEMTTTERYVVIADQWFIFAGQMLVGVNNPHGFYFDPKDPRGAELFIQMELNTSTRIMTEAMKYNNATVAYFIIEKPRLGIETYNNIIQQAQQNNLQTYPGGIFYYKGEEKLRIFYYRKPLAD